MVVMRPECGRKGRVKRGCSREGSRSSSCGALQAGWSTASFPPSRCLEFEHEAWHCSHHLGLLGRGPQLGRCRREPGPLRIEAKGDREPQTSFVQRQETTRKERKGM